MQQYINWAYESRVLRLTKPQPHPIVVISCAAGPQHPPSLHSSCPHTSKQYLHEICRLHVRTSRYHSQVFSLCVHTHLYLTSDCHNFGWWMLWLDELPLTT